MTKFIAVLFVTTVTGVLVDLLWSLFTRLFPWKDMTRYYYLCLKGIILSFAVPMVFIGILISQREEDLWFGTYLQSTQWIQSVSTGLFLIWVIGAVIQLLRKAGKWMDMIQFRREHEEAMTGPESEILAEVRQKMGILRKIPLYRGELSLVPCVCGCIHPGIFMGMQEFGGEELSMIFKHELFHYLHRDLWYYALLSVLEIVYWFCPLFSLNILYNQYHRWSKYACDDDVCLSEPGHAYSCCLLKVSLYAADMAGEIGCGLAKKENEVIRRVERIRSKQKNHKKKWIVAWLTIMCLCFGSVAYAAGFGTTTGYEAMYEATDVATQVAGENSQTLTEYEEAADVNDDVTVIEIGSGVDARATVVDIDATIPAKTQAQTSGFSKSSGTIVVSFAMTPSDKDMQVGIIEPDGVKRYVLSDNYVNHEFEVRKSGKHKVYFYNPNSVSVSVDGHYIK